MKKIICFIIISFILIIFGNFAFAEEREFGAEDVYNALPENARGVLDENGITPENGGALGLNFLDVLKAALDTFKDQAAKPLKLLCALCAAVLMCSLAESLSEGGALKGVFSAAGVLCGAGITAAAVYDVIGETLGVLSSAADFMLVFIPVTAGLAAVLGHVSSAAAVNSAAIAATQLFSQLSVNFLAPLCGTVMGFSVAGAVHPQLKADKIGELIKKFVVWGLTLIMTIFMSVLSLQTLIASASDNTALKAAKFMVSQGIPIVGSTISDAVNTLGGSLSIMKGSVGTYGMIAAAVIMFPSIASVVCYETALWCAEALAEMLGLKEMSALIKSGASVMTIILAVCVCFLLLNFCAAILLLAATTE